MTTIMTMFMYVCRRMALGDASSVLRWSVLGLVLRGFRTRPAVLFGQNDRLPINWIYSAHLMYVL